VYLAHLVVLIYQNTWTGYVILKAILLENDTASQSEMTRGYSSYISKATLDEASSAYQRLEDIAKVISDTVTIDCIIRPVYNFKVCGN